MLKRLLLVPLCFSLSSPLVEAASLLPPQTLTSHGLSVGIHASPFATLTMLAPALRTDTCLPCAAPKTGASRMRVSGGFEGLPWLQLPDFESMQDVWLARDVAQLPVAG